jgi:Tol biopolymer transport system component
MALWDTLKSSRFITKECTDLPDYQGTTYIYGKGNEVMYVSIKTESRGKVFINMDSCAVRRETYKLPEKDDTNFSTALSGINLSPDGKWIVYRYFLIDAATGQKQKMYGAPEPKSEGINVNFSWSSDSKYVVYSSYNTGNVYVYDVEKNGTKKLPIPAKNGATFLPNSHDVYLHDYPNGVEKNTVFNIDSWTGEERTLPMGQAIP